MNTAAIYHRPDSEFAFLYQPNTMRLRLRTARADVQQVKLVCGDPYLMATEKWDQKPIMMARTLSTDLYDFWTAEVMAIHNRLAYGFQIIGQDGTSIFYGDQGLSPLERTNQSYFKMPYFHEIDRFKAPEWVKKTVWYQIFPERFGNGDVTNDPEGTLSWSTQSPQAQDFYGGDLQGVIDHLDHLVDLGINGLYFCPIFAAHSNHKYDTIDYLEIDPHFGDKALFRKLVDECHRRGIKIMLDAVFNHMGDQSPQWQDVLQKGADSQYADWFHIHEFPVSYQEGKNFEDATDITYEVFATTPHMPKLNTANPEVQDYLLKVARYWIEEFDIDAWRLDVANEVDHHFWKKFRQVCDAAKPDFYILGEIWHSSQSWLNGDEFSAVMNYAYTDAILDYFVKKEISADKMISELNNQLMLYRDQTNQVQFNVLDSHDTARLLTAAGGDRDLMRQVMAFTYIQPGVPCLYYGDEYGMTGTDDPGCRKCMVWDTADQDLEMYQFVKSLIALRKAQQEVLSEGTMTWSLDPQTPDILKITRQFKDHQITGIFNLATTVVEIMQIEQPKFSQLVTNDAGMSQIAPKGFILY